MILGWDEDAACVVTEELSEEVLVDASLRKVVMLTLVGR